MTGHEHEQAAARMRRRAAGSTGSAPRRRVGTLTPTSAGDADRAPRTMQLPLEIAERRGRASRSEMPIDADATMTRPISSSAATGAHDPGVERERRRGRPDARADVVVAPRSSVEPPDGRGERVARAARSRETCRGSRRPATAAPCRRAVPQRCGALHGGRRDRRWLELDVGTTGLERSARWRCAARRGRSARRAAPCRGKPRRAA